MPADTAGLENVADMEVFARVGLPATDGVVHHLKRMSDVKDGFKCPNEHCRKGGFDLRTDVAEKFVSKMKTEAHGLVRCKGFEEAGGSKKSCEYLMAYLAKIKYTH